jgi:hypothetical protein
MKHRRLHNACSLISRLELFAVALFFLPYGMTFSVVVAPLITPAESSENRNSREQSEELSVDLRVHRIRHSVVRVTHCRVELSPGNTSKTSPLHSRPGIFLSGHRLSIDLLAPIRC